MTISQIKAMRIRMKNDPRYRNAKDAGAAARRNADKVRREQERKVRGSKGGKK